MRSDVFRICSEIPLVKSVGDKDPEYALQEKRQISDIIS